MPKPEVLADHLCDLARELASHRRGSGPHWVMVADIEAAMRRHGLEIDGDEVQAAIAICVGRRTLKAEGKPAHSVSPIEPWEV